MLSKFKPVAAMTAVLTVLTTLTAIEAVLPHVPSGWVAATGAATAVVTVVLGALTHSAVTPLARPRDADGNRLVPAVPSPPR